MSSRPSVKTGKMNEANKDSKTKTARKRTAPTEDDAASLETTVTPKRPHLTLTPASKKLNSKASWTLLDSLPTTPPATPSKTPSVPKSEAVSRKQRLTLDPINKTIYDLRKAAHSFEDIAKLTNEQCQLSGDNAVTTAACYSRFFRNGPLVAKDRGEEWNREWYVHMDKKAMEKEDEPKCDTAGVEKERGEELEDVVMRSMEEVKARFWADVTAVVNQSLDDKDKLTEAQVKQVYDFVQDDDS